MYLVKYSDIYKKNKPTKAVIICKNVDIYRANIASIVPHQFAFVRGPRRTVYGTTDSFDLSTYETPFLGSVYYLITHWQTLLIYIQYVVW